MNIYSDIYRSFQRVLMSQKRFTMALEIAEQSKMRTFLDYGLLKDYKLVNLSFHNIQELIKKVNTTLIYYSILYDENQFYRFHRFQRLPKGENNVYFYPTEILIWVIQPTGEIFCEQVDLTQFWQEEMLSLGGLIRQINEEINQDHLSNYQQDLTNLYKLLIEPIHDYLPQNPDDLITICPQDFLYLLPFPALINCQGEYLIKNYTMIMIPSLSLLELALNNQSQHQQDTPRENDYFLMGNPTMPHLCLTETNPPFVLPNLTQGLAEINMINNLFHTQAIEGSYATKHRFISALESAKIFHCTTYCLLSELGGFPGAIALAPSLEDPGLLTPIEIAQLKLKAKLITISHGYRKSSYIWGNSVEKLATALITAGLESLLLGLWHNDHPATNLLLKEFYQNLSKNNNPAQALRQAMLTVEKDYPHPLNWAYFCLLGIN